MAVHKLLLYPAKPDCPLAATDSLAEELQSIGLIGASFGCKSERRYRTGDRFLQLITFLGCSPAIELDPPADKSERETACENGRLCHIRLSRTLSGPRFRADRQMPPPRCPQCRKPELQWRELIDRWRDTPGETRWSCRECGYHGQLFDLNFRKSGGFGNTFIEIWGIYPSEAVPGDSLLSKLKGLTGVDWNTMYIKD